MISRLDSHPQPPIFLVVTMASILLLGACGHNHVPNLSSGRQAAGWFWEHFGRDYVRSLGVCYLFGNVLDKLEGHLGH